jgi:putative transposase
MFDPKIHNRRSIRLKGYDYSHSGYYFITICTQNKSCLFGLIENGIMHLNELGVIVNSHLENIGHRFPQVRVVDYVIMPNHIHCILVIENDEETHAKRSTLGQILRFFKSKSAIEINKMLGRENDRLWQRNYYEHIIRNEEELANIQEYIFRNPSQWDKDEYYIL